ncbi:hypothetical protein QOT17_015973 [Balamuthia mandrillaris]
MASTKSIAAPIPLRTSGPVPVHKPKVSSTPSITTSTSTVPPTPSTLSLSARQITTPTPPTITTTPAQAPSAVAPTGGSTRPIPSVSSFVLQRQANQMRDLMVEGALRADEFEARFELRQILCGCCEELEYCGAAGKAGQEADFGGLLFGNFEEENDVEEDGLFSQTDSASAINLARMQYLAMPRLGKSPAPPRQPRANVREDGTPADPIEPSLSSTDSPCKTPETEYDYWAFSPPSRAHNPITLNSTFDLESMQKDLGLDLGFPLEVEPTYCMSSSFAQDWRVLGTFAPSYLDSYNCPTMTTRSRSYSEPVPYVS